jgi:hypothetical protein
MRRRWIICAASAAIAVAVCGSLRAADERPQNLAEAKAKEQVQSLAEVATLPILTADSPADVVQVFVHDNDLVLTSKLAPTEQAVVRAPGLGGLTTVRITHDQRDPTMPPVDTFNLDNVDYTVPGIVAIHTSINQSPGKLTLSQDHDRIDDQLHSVQLIQTTGEIGEGDHRVMLYVQVTVPPEVNKKLAADSIVDLRRRYPAETQTYLEPIFRTLRQEGFLSQVDPRLAWQVFAEAFVPSPKLQSDLKTVLAKLDSDDYQERQAASRTLNDLGQPAALALMRVDRKSLSDEQRGRVDAFVAKFRTVQPEEAERLRNDRDFLLDCLYAEDLGIRTRALDQLRKVTGRPVEFDLSADAAHRLTAIEKLRAAIGAPPTTQEATPQ